MRGLFFAFAKAIQMALLAWGFAGITAGPVFAEVRPLQPHRISLPLSGEEEPAALPYRWDRKHAQSGKLRLEFDLPHEAREHEWGAYFPKIGNSYRVWLGSILIADVGSADPDRTNTAHRPRLIPLPIHSSSSLRLVVELHALAGADGGMSALLVGPMPELSRQFEQASRWQVLGAVAIAIASLVLGALGLMVWLQQREQIYAYYAMAELTWSLRTMGHYLPDNLPIEWPYWGFSMTSLFCLALAGMSLFGLALVGRDSVSLTRRVQIFFGVSIAVLAACYAFDMHSAWRWWRLGILAVCLGCAAVVAVETVRKRSIEAIVFVAVCGVAVIAGARDWWVISFKGTDYLAKPTLTFVWLLFGVSMAWILAIRLRQATQVAARHAQDIKARLAQQEQQLAAVFEEKRRESAAQAASDERRRVLQDMHDGVGHELLGALQSARLDQSSRENISSQIQRALDYLKLTVDVLQEGTQDMRTMLGALRYRLSLRLEASGIRMQWVVGSLPNEGAIETRRLRELQMMLYEAFSNLLAHSQAQRALLQIVYVEQTQRVEVLMVDDGKGFPDDSNTGNGLGSIRSRAARLGGELMLGNGLHEDHAGAGIRLRFPVSDPSATSAERAPVISAPGGE